MDLRDKKSFLLRICDTLGEAESALHSKNFALAQGALRAAFNGFGWFDYNAQPIPARKAELSELSEGVFKIRECLVNGVETHGINLNIVVENEKIYKRLGEARNVLLKYVSEWYKV